ncbi:hypothetical protein LSH36_174g08007 [Paralvinella palmiformis]|uniref:Uncharacterized protein n=1 Tax=Paralvinella palmiformis TaxID=53620 RepID=A0AAD9N7V2_9ANNE|nr:hypothetical protein LSH36_174g08007 [Paralvinella palmiformis]
MNGSSFFHRITAYDAHITAKYDATIPQLALLWIWMTALFLYLIRLPSSVVILCKQGLGGGGSGDDRAPDPGQRKPTENGLDTVESGSTSGVKVVNKVKEATDEKRFSKVKPPPTFKEFLLYVIQLGVILLYFYFSDYVKVVGSGFLALSGFIAVPQLWGNSGEVRRIARGGTTPSGPTGRWIGRKQPLSYMLSRSNRGTVSGALYFTLRNISKRKQASPSSTTQSELHLIISVIE